MLQCLGLARRPHEPRRDSGLSATLADMHAPSGEERASTSASVSEESRAPRTPTDLPWMKLDKALQMMDLPKFTTLLESLNTSQRLGVCRYAEVNGRTLLSRACSVGCAPAVELLLGEGADAGRLSRVYGSPLLAAAHAVAAGGGPDASPTSPSGSPGDSGRDSASSPGTAAATAPDFRAVICQLIDAGADPFLQGPDGLHCHDVLTKSPPLTSLISTWLFAKGPTPSISAHSPPTPAGQAGRRRRPGPNASASSPPPLASGPAAAAPVPAAAAFMRGIEAQSAPFSGLLKVYIEPYGHRDVSLLWLAVVPRRCSQPYGSLPPKALSRELWAFSSYGSSRPVFRAELDGCTLRREGPHVVTLGLLPSDRKGAFCSGYMQGCQDTGQERWLLMVRPWETSAAGLSEFSAFLAACGGGGGAAAEGAAEHQAVLLRSSSMAAAASAAQQQQHPPHYLYQGPVTSSNPYAPASSGSSATSLGRGNNAGQQQHYSSGMRMVLPIALAMAGVNVQPPCAGGSALQHHAALLLQQTDQALAQAHHAMQASGASPQQEAEHEGEELDLLPRRQCSGAVPAVCSCEPGTEVVELISPPSQPQPQQQQQQQQQQAQPQATCCVCMVQPAVLGLKHGRSVHVCTCFECARLVIKRALGSTSGDAGVVRCPLCRQAVEEVLLVY